MPQVEADCTAALELDKKVGLRDFRWLDLSRGGCFLHTRSVPCSARVAVLGSVSPVEFVLELGRWVACALDLMPDEPCVSSWYWLAECEGSSAKRDGKGVHGNVS